MAFPSNPSTWDTYTDDHGTLWKYNGFTWSRITVSKINDSNYAGSSANIPLGGAPGQVLQIDSTGKRQWKTMEFNYATIPEVDSRILAQMGNSFSNRTVLLNTNTAIFADGEAGTPDPNEGPGWYYKNTAGNKINWYFYGGANATNYQLGSFDGWYAVIEIRKSGSYPWLTVYTEPTGSGDASWYKSRINYVDENTTQALDPGLYLFHTAGLDVTGIYSGLTRVSLPVGANTVGSQDSTENLWLMALSTSSNLPEGTNEFVVREQAVVLGGITTNYQHVALPTYQAPYTDYYKGSYSSDTDYPESGLLGQWIINSSDDTILVWDVESGDWVATGATAVDTPTSTTQDYPFQYVYSSVDGSGYGFTDAYPTTGWQNTPDGKIQAVGSGAAVGDRRIKFATLKNPGDQVTIKLSDNTTIYNRYAIVGATAGSSPTWLAGRQTGSGLNYYASDNMEFQHAYMEPYWGGTTYGGGLSGPRNSTGYGYTGNAGELPMTYRVGDDYRIEIYIDGTYFCRTTNVPPSGVDLYLLLQGNTGRIVDQTTGNGANFIGGTAPSASGARYFISTVSTPGTATELDSAGGFFLYSDTAAGDPSDVELTDEEAQAARFSRVFRASEYSGMTLQERADDTYPVVKQDEKVLNNVEYLARGYFHSLDLGILEIQEKMSLYADALAAAKAGSVEVCLATLQSLQIPTAASVGAVAFTPNYTFDGTNVNTASQFYYSGDALYDTYGIDELDFSDSFVTIHFKDSASFNAWRSQARELILDYPSGSKSWEGTHALTTTVEYSVSSTYNYVHYQPTSLPRDDREDLADTLASAGAGTSVLNVTLGAPTPQSPADALGETDVVNQLIATLQLHLQKFPR